MGRQEELVGWVERLWMRLGAVVESVAWRRMWTVDVVAVAERLTWTALEAEEVVRS